MRHSQYVEWLQAGSPLPEPIEWSPPGLELNRTLHMTKRPSIRMVPFERLSMEYGARFFRTALARYIVLANEPNLTAHQLERRLWTVHIPFTKVPVWHHMKFRRADPSTGVVSTADSIHVSPPRKDNRGRLMPGRFDTALVNDGTGETTGINGKSSCCLVPLI